MRKYDRTIRITHMAMIFLLATAGRELSAGPVDRDTEVPDQGPVCGEMGGAQPIGAISVVVFSDFQCVYCAEVAPLLKRLRESGGDAVHVRFKHAPATDHPDTLLPHEAALAAGDQGKFWEMHDRILAGPGRVSRDRLVAYAGELDLDMPRFLDALDRHIFRERIDQDVLEAVAFGVTATPTFFVNGQKMVGVGEIRRFVDRFLDAGAVSEDKSRYDIDIEGSPFRGSADAAVILVEFVDFGCDLCAEVRPTIEEVVARYPDRVRWVFKHFLLSDRPDVVRAHEAALAAGEQGKFWEMHDRLLVEPDLPRVDDLFRYAIELDLDVPRFAAALENGVYSERIRRDAAEGKRNGVRGTPTFFVNGLRMTGVQPLSAFLAIIEAKGEKGVRP